MSTLKKSSIFLAVIFTATFFSQCTLKEDIAKITDAAKNLKILIGTPEFNALTHFEIKDAKTNEYITAVATIKVTGKDAASIYNNLGQKQTEYNSVLGMVDLVVDPHNVDSNLIKTKPIEFDVTIKAPGYNSVTKIVSLTENKFKNIIVELVKLDNAPEGVVVSQNQNFGTTNSTGALTQTSTQTLNSGTVTVEVPKGVVMKDETGNPVTGTVESQVIFYDPMKSEGQEAIPGGLDVSANVNGNTENVQFVSAGMFGVNLTAGDQSVKTFENGGIRIKTELDPKLINPYTDKPIAENDVIEMWSVDEGSGEWKLEKMDTVRKVNGKLVLEETVKHLSVWNWDFKREFCVNGSKIVWKGNTNKIANVRILAKGTDSIFSRTKNEYALPGHITYGFSQFINVPRNEPVKIYLTSLDNNFTFTPSTIDIANLCQGNDIEVVITQKDIITVKANLSLTAVSDPNVIIKPNGSIKMKKTNLKDWIVYPVKDGECDLYVQVNSDYDISATYGNSTVSGKVRVNSVTGNKLQVVYTPIKLSGQTGESVTLPAVDKNADNTVDVLYTIILESLDF